jgi:hypothetical protein
MKRSYASIAAVVIIVVVVAAAVVVYRGRGPVAGTGTLVFQVSDQPNAIDNFTALVVQVSKVSVHSASDNLENTWSDFTPSTTTFDLVKLQGDNVQTLISTPLAVGTYTQVRLVVTSAVGTLKTGTIENVTVPSGEIKLVKSFQIEENKTTTFVLDLNVVATGVGNYMLTPVAGKVTSGPPSSTPPLSYTGALVFQVSDQPNAIGDFASLTVNVSKVSVHSATDNAENDNLDNNWIDFTPSNSSFDLVPLQGENVQTLISTPLAAGMYTQVRLVVTSAYGVLKAGGTENVTVPSGELRFVQSFQIEENKTTTFVLDLNVVKQGNENYKLTPVAGKVNTQ